MANCFGDVVDNFKLDRMPRYVGRPKTREDRAREATALVNDDGKYQKAIEYVRSLKSWWGNGVSTLCLIYNETGDTLRHVEDHDWWGYMGPTPYPTEIGNGQWASFLHVKKTSASAGSQAGVVYRGKDSRGNDRDFLICWSSPWAAWHSNTAYCDIGNPGAFTSRWPTIYGSVNNAGGASSATRGDAAAGACSVHATIGEHSSSFFTAYVAIPFGP